MMTLTPRTTPNTVSPLRILCARSVSIACFRFSPCACAIALSVCPQRFDGIQLRRAHGGIDSEKEADSGRQDQRDDDGAHGRKHGNRSDATNECDDQVGAKKTK